MKKLLALSILSFSLFVAPCVWADDDSVIRPHLRTRCRDGKSQRSIATDLNVSPSLVSMYLREQVQTSPTITRNFRRRSPETFLDLCTREKRVQELRKLPSQLDLRPSQTKVLAPSMFLFLSDRAEKAEENFPDVLAVKPSSVQAYARTHPMPKGGQAMIAVGHRIEADGKAAFYDHQTVRAATDVKTVSVYGAHHDQAHLATYARSLPFQMYLSEGEMPARLDAHTEEGMTLLEALRGTGLLVIAGRASKYEGHTAQNNFEADLIRQAMVRGQPVLAICAGCWPLWQYTPKQGKGEIPMPKGKLKPVTGHAAGKMIYMSETHGRAVYNSQIHGVEIPEGTLLKAFSKTNTLRVNSVHSTAPDETFVPDLFQVSAWSKKDRELAPKNRHGDIMDTKENTVEAFESKFGAPVLGIQWHPEAYGADSNTKGVKDAPKHRSIIQDMTRAGQAYAYKRRLLEELHTVFQAINE